jgi:hypothetical protein
VVGKVLFGVPFVGNVATFALGAALFLLVTLGLGVLISTVSQNQGQAIQLAFMVMLPQVLLSGLIFRLGGRGHHCRTQPRSIGSGTVNFLVSAQHVSIRFGSFIAVDSVSLSVGSGEVVGLLGANGAGKTTLIRALLGLLRPVSGQALLFGSVPSVKTRRRVGYVPQTLGLYDDMTVQENWSFTNGAFGTRQPELPATIAATRDELVGKPSGYSMRQDTWCKSTARCSGSPLRSMPSSACSAATTFRRRPPWCPLTLKKPLWQSRRRRPGHET